MYGKITFVVAVKILTMLFYLFYNYFNWIEKNYVNICFSLNFSLTVRSELGSIDIFFCIWVVLSVASIDVIGKTCQKRI